MRQKIMGILRYLLACFVVGCGMMVNGAEKKTHVNVNVGVVLDLSSWVGKMELSCINAALNEFYDSHPHHSTRILLHIRDSKADVVEAATQAMELIHKIEVEAILGPEKWLEAYFIMKVGEKAEVPIISFAPKISTLSYLNSPYFFQVAQNHSSQVHAISDIIKTFMWQQAVAIYEDDEFGKWIVADLTNALQDIYVHVHRSVIDPTASNNHIEQQLCNLSLMRAKVFVVHVGPNLASRVFATANELGMMGRGYVWILTDATSNVLNTLDSSILSSMQGVLGLKAYVPSTVKLHNFITRWRSKFREDNPTIDNPQMDVYGLWAYDATWALAMAIERIRTHNPNSTLNGKKISESLQKTKFKGVSGEFNVMKNQLESPNLEIVNVIGNEKITIGYWKSEICLTGKFNRKENLRSIIWPGYSIKGSRGLKTLTNKMKKLKIGIPKNDEFMEFAQRMNDSIVGYSIDIFEAVVEQLPYNILFEYVFFEDTSSSSSSYNNLIQQVFEQKYDAAIGDITILANRSVFVDFTLPFTEAGIGMVVPVKRNLRNHAWVFLKPLTLNLWIASFCFFVFMGFVVWILEHRNHEHFHSPSSLQIGTSLCFSFCTIVFAHWETLVSNLARFVVVIWFFVVFILTQSYTASLTSWLTVQQLQPVTDINQIIKNDWHVGYQNGSYLLNTLQHMGIKTLVPYTSLDHLHELFKNGSCKGGIDAVIDEIPYIKIFLSRYSNDYVMADSLFKANGFAFAFPLGSSIVNDMSKAMLKVIESDKISQIQEKWFGKKNGHQSCASCLEQDSSSSLDLSYFWALFVIAAAVAVFTLVLYFFPFISNLPNRNQSLSLPCICSWLWTRMASIFRSFRLKFDPNIRNWDSGIGADQPPIAAVTDSSAHSDRSKSQIS